MSPQLLGEFKRLVAKHNTRHPQRGARQRSMMFCKQRYKRTSRREIEQFHLMRMLEMHLQGERFKANVPRGFRRDAAGADGADEDEGARAFAIARWQMIHIDGNAPNAAGRPLNMGVGIDSMTNESSVKKALSGGSPRLLSRVGKFRRKGRVPDLPKHGPLKRNLISYVERCAAFGLPIEIGREWHTVEQIRDIVESKPVTIGEVGSEYAPDCGSIFEEVRPGAIRKEFKAFLRLFQIPFAHSAPQAWEEND